MKPILYLVACLMLLSACKKTQIDSEYDTSLRVWQEFKASVNNSYVYTVTASSDVGIFTETKITVSNGVVTARDYTETSGNPAINNLKRWRENGVTLNTHTEGALLITMDEVYVKAKNEWLTADRDKNNAYFETKNNGMISTCSYVPKNVADHPGFGIHISSIAAFIK